MPTFKHTEFPHYYRRHEPGETEDEFSTRMAAALERLIETEGPDTIAAFFAEPVMGAGGGILPPNGYFEKIQAVLRRYDILFVADEVICGFARTGEMWGSQTFGIRPDMMTSAKALSAAMQPISAVLVNARIHDAMLAQSDRYGNFAHGFTYAGHPVAAAVALEVQKIYAEMDVVARAKRLGAALETALSNAENAVAADQQQLATDSLSASQRSFVSNYSVLFNPLIAALFYNPQLLYGLGFN